VVALIVAVTVVAEVGDFHRFDNPRQLMAYLRLTPSEHSSGTSVRRGGITKAGSGLARRVLIEGACPSGAARRSRNPSAGPRRWAAWPRPSTAASTGSAPNSRWSWRRAICSRSSWPR